MRMIVTFLALFLSSTMVWADSEIKIPASKDPQAMYDRVWDAAIDTLFELGLPIAFMSRPDGYMVTDREWDNTKRELANIKGSLRFFPDRVRVTMRFTMTDDSVNVKISSAQDQQAEAYTTKAYRKEASSPFYYWEVKGPFLELERGIVDRISSRFKPIEGTK